MVQWVKNSPEMQETWKMWVQSLCWEDPLEKEMATHSSVGSHKELDTTEWLSTH